MTAVTGFVQFEAYISRLLTEREVGQPGYFVFWSFTVLLFGKNSYKPEKRERFRSKDEKERGRLSYLLEIQQLGSVLWAKSVHTV